MRASEANHLDINLAAFRPLHPRSVRVRPRAMFSLVFEAAAAALRDLPATGGIAVCSVFPSVRFDLWGWLDRTSKQILLFAHILHKHRVRERHAGV